MAGIIAATAANITTRARPMTTIALIHGSTQDAKAWDLVRPLLSEQGHEAIAIELPANRPDWSATDFARVVAGQIPDDCVVVAHSASGVLLPTIARMRRVQALVYLAAMIPKAGMSAMEQYEASPDMFNPEWVAAGKRWSDPANWRALADEFLFHDVLLTNREFAYSTLRLMKIDGMLREPAPEMPPVRSLCVIAARDRTINPEWQKSAWGGLHAGMLSFVDTGHCPQIASPREVAGSILFACDAGRWERATALLRERRKAGCPMPPPSESANPIDYDAFKQLGRREQIRIFNSITAENRAELVRTQIRRWLDANRHRLNADQIAVLEDNIAFVRAELYVRPRDPELERQQERLIDRTYTLLSREDVSQAMYGNAPYIPPR